MKAFLAPGIALIHRLPNQKKLPLLSALFMLPLGILYYQTRQYVEPALAYTLLGTLILAIYAMTAYYFQAAAGWMRWWSVSRLRRAHRPRIREPARFRF